MAIRRTPRTPLRLLTLMVATTLGVLPAVTTAEPTTGELDSEEVAFFESKVRPLLIERCYECHSTEAGESEGDLLLDSQPDMQRGGHRGPSIVPGKATESLVFQAVTYNDPDMQMPPDGKLNSNEIEILRQWIQAGAPDPRREPTSQVEHEASPIERDPKEHWTFTPPSLATPTSIAADQVDGEDRDLIDTHAHATAKQAGIDRASIADRATLIRRLYFDLIGTPPTYHAVKAFAKSERPDAYIRLVDELLSRPEFGERFGRHWLDVSRYANTIGYGLAGRDRRIHGSERFRDWSVNAFDQDMRFDEMIMHQLAGDRTDPDNLDGNLDAMGFLTVGRQYLNKHDIVDDRIDVVTRGLLGLTVACARCHDHKFDPIPTMDYYSLYGIFDSSRVADKESASPLAMVDIKKPRDSKIFVRGQPGNRGDVAPRQYLTSLRSDTERRFNDGSGRLELAQRIASPDNPLTARVFVNRVWAILTGRPLVETPSDFGFRTEPPAVPAVLDDLAADFATHFSTKRLVRRIVLSRIYRQSSQSTENARETDPENRLLARSNRRRRDFESLRDSMLTVTNHIDRQRAGDAVEITLATPPPRRTIYAFIDRQNLPSLFRTFDLASPDAHAPKRYYTTVPQQALYLLNHGHASFLARRLASRIRVESGPANLSVDESRWNTITQMVRATWQRDPTAAEYQSISTFLSQPAREFSDYEDPRSRWQYGLGKIIRKNEKPTAITDFRRFPVFNNNRWSQAKEIPVDGPIGHAQIGTELGHPGRDDSHTVVRRWTAPISGEVRLSGMTGHRSKDGDGVETTIFVGGKRIFGVNNKSNNRPFRGLRAWVEEGQSVDFVASPGASDSFDSFFWRIKVRLVANDGRTVEADSVADFAGPLPERPVPLTRLEQLAQVLLLSNEFAFVD